MIARQDAGLLYTLSYQTEDRAVVDNRKQALDRFLAGVEAPAFRMAQIATRNADDALDIVQDAMIKLVQKYGTKPENEWRPLFFTILNSRIMDYHRKSTLTRRLFGWLEKDEEGESGASEEIVASGPLESLQASLTIDRLLAALDQLTERQQQAFMLRTWQGFNVAETARMMKCSEGSVKTHLSRATEALMKAVSEDEK